MKLWRCGKEIFENLIVSAHVFCMVVCNASHLICKTAHVFRRIKYISSQFATHFHNFNKVNEPKIITNSQ